MAPDQNSTTPVKMENYNHEIIERIEGCISVYFKPDHKSRYPKSPIKQQIGSGLNFIEVERSIFKNDKQLMRWINKSCPKRVKAYIRIALTNFYGNPLDRNVKVNLK